jgi:hypothetical protein
VVEAESPPPPFPLVPPLLGLLSVLQQETKPIQATAATATAPLNPLCRGEGDEFDFLIVLLKKATVCFIFLKNLFVRKLFLPGGLKFEL